MITFKTSRSEGDGSVTSDDDGNVSVVINMGMALVDVKALVDSAIADNRHHTVMNGCLPVVKAIVEQAIQEKNDRLA